MKKYLILSAISCIFLLPLIVIFGFIPMTYYFGIDNKEFLERVATPLLTGKYNNIFMFYCMLFGLIGVALIFSVTLMILPYTKNIDKLDDALIENQKLKQRLLNKINSI